MHRKLPPRPADIPHLVRVHRELRAAALARRSGARQGLADRQDAGRRLAAVRQPAAAVRLHVGASRARSCCSWAASSAQRREWQHEASLEWHVLQHPEHAGVQRLGARPQPPLPRRAGAARARFRPGRLRVDRLPTTRDNSVIASCGSARTAARRCSSSAISRRCRARITASACRAAGRWRELLTATRRVYGGSGMGNFGGVDAAPVPAHGRLHSLDADAAAACRRCSSSPKRTDAMPPGRRERGRDVAGRRPRRAVIENIAPRVDGGRFADQARRRRTRGGRGGHASPTATTRSRCVLLHRRREATSAWNESPMAALGNDRWRGDIHRADLGRYATR